MFSVLDLKLNEIISISVYFSFKNHLNFYIIIKFFICRLINRINIRQKVEIFEDLGSGRDGLVKIGKKTYVICNLV